VLNWQAQSGLIVTDSGHGIQIDIPQGGTTTFEGAQYSMLQFHFHHASENTIDGKQFPLEMHVVHKNAVGKLLVVGVLFASGAANTFLSQLAWDKLPTGGRDVHNVHHDGTDAKHVGTTHVPLTGAINVLDALPQNRSYWTWPGSLTTPPCTQGVTWVLLQQPVTISPDQVKAFPYQNNFRPPQPLNARTVYSGSADSSSFVDARHLNFHQRWALLWPYVRFSRPRPSFTWHKGLTDHRSVGRRSARCCKRLPSSVCS
jgi:carbonic anhydrase